jgi:hypothetical protein
MMLQPSRMLPGAHVQRIVWLPGADRLFGECHCGAARESGDPAELCEWLLDHPSGHQDVAPKQPSEATPLWTADSPNIPQPALA